MTFSTSTFPLDAYHHARLELWHSASIEPSIGLEATDPLVQVGIEAVLAWLRTDSATPSVLLDLDGQPHGPLGSQLSLVGSLMDPAQAPADRCFAPLRISGSLAALLINRVWAAAG